MISMKNNYLVASICLQCGRPGFDPGSGRSPGEENGNPLQYSCLENPMDGGAWWATVPGVAKSRTRLSDFTFTFLLWRLKAGGERDNWGWDVWMVSPTQWTWVWASSRSWWWTGKPGVLQSMRLQKLDTTERLNSAEKADGEVYNGSFKPPTFELTAQSNHLLKAGQSGIMCLLLCCSRKYTYLWSMLTRNQNPHVMKSLDLMKNFLETQWIESRLNNRRI